MSSARVAARGASGRRASRRQLSREGTIRAAPESLAWLPKSFFRLHGFNPDVKGQLVTFVVTGNLPAAGNRHPDAGQHGSSPRIVNDVGRGALWRHKRRSRAIKALTCDP